MNFDTVVVVVVMQIERPKLSYNSQLPSSSCNSGMLLVGPSRLTQPLASALLQVQFDPRTGHGSRDAAIEALRKHCVNSPSKRTIHTVESLEEKSWRFRMDHIVFLTTTAPGEREETFYLANQWLHDDYLLFQRVTIVQVHESGADVDEHMKKCTNAKIPTLQMQLEDPISLLTVSRMLLQRTKLGTRQGNQTIPHISPLIFGN